LLYIIKKDNIYNVFFALFIILSICLNFNNPNQVTPASATYCNNKIIVIDAGHGYPDGGAVGNLGTLEKDLNLIISHKIGEYFIKSGAHVIYTRAGDNAIASDLSKKIAEIKREDMKQRLLIRDSSNADLFISIHMNKFSDPKYRGAQTFYDGELAESKMFAEYVQNSLIKNVDKDNKRESKDSKNSLYILKNSKIPSILVECGFLSNHYEEKMLLTEDYQNKIAFAIFLGATDFLAQK